MYGTCPQPARKLINERRDAAKLLREEAKERKKQLATNRNRKPERVSISTEATNFGQICEQIVPAFTTFPYSQGDCRILFKPIDYVVFAGLCNKRRVNAIKFVEFKTGGGILTQKQRQIRKCVTAGKVKHEVIGQ
jgi:predicted Holliday junction resolvase-like endonuclease